MMPRLRCWLVSVAQEEAEVIQARWEAAGLSPILTAVGCGTADYEFVPETDLVLVREIAGEAWLDPA